MAPATLARTTVPVRPALVVGLLLLGLALRLPGLSLLGTGDVPVWKVWAYTVATHGLAQVYPIAGRRQIPALTLHNLDLVRQGVLLAGNNSYNRVSVPTDYPPAMPAVLGGIGWLYRGLIAPDFADRPAFNVLLKTPLVLADALAAWLLFALVRRRSGPERPALAWITALAYWCNPTVILAGSVLGYLDALFILPLLGALAALVLDRFGVGWAAWGLAWMLKLQGAFVGPALAILSLPRSLPRLLGYGTAALAVIGLCWSPFLAGGTALGVVAGLRVNTQEDYLSANQANLWWLWSYVWEWHAEGKGPGVRVAIVPSSLIRDRGVADLDAWGEGLFLAFVVITGLIWAWGRRGHPAGAPLGLPDVALLPLQLYAATMLLPSIHENHLLPALPLVLALAGLAAAGVAPALTRPLAILYSLLTVIVGLNLLLFYGFGKGVPAPLPRLIAGFDSTVALAAANVLLFAVTVAVWSVGMVRQGRRLGPSTPACV
ncbi:MAG: hypothetical protein M3Z04_05145 [Chloroflexota bacterium]|nr:hypothetical protein [Chloroflexota bacterium]